MKPKKITKKLTLNKETIAELNNKDKSNIKGGKRSTLWIGGYYQCEQTGRMADSCDTGCCPEAPDRTNY